MAGLPEPIVCSEFWRNRGGESVRIQLREYEGQVLVDLRVHVMREGKLVPTHKGLALTIRKLPELTVAVGKALKRARELGLFEDKS
jgi:Transcriptional Coactivator p15 (PC4)